MWQYWQHNISEEAKKYGYGEDKILRESNIKAAAEAWFAALPKECLAELKQRLGKAIAAANTKNVPLLPTDLMNIQLILKAHKVKPLLGSIQASMTAVETMLHSGRLESLELESVEDESIITEGYERVVINTLEDAGFKRGDAWFDDGILYVAKRNLIAAAKTALQDNRDIYKLPKIKLNPDMKESIEEDGEELTEAPYKTSTGTPKFVGKYQFTPFVEGSISGWFIRVQGFAKEVGFVEKPASKNTKTSVVPYSVYFHTEVSGHPQLKANAWPGNETRVIQSNQFRFAPKQLLKGVAMWMDAYGYRMVGEETVSEAVGNTDKGGYSHWTNHTKVIRTFSWRHKETGRSVSSGGAVPWLTPAEKSEWGEHAYNGYFVFYNTVNGTTFGGMYDTEQKAQAALDNAKRDHQKEVAKYVTAPQVRKRIQELENEIVGIRNSPSMAGGAVRMKRLEDEIKRLKQQLRSLGVKRESVEVVDGDINEAKKKLTPEQKAALKAYKLSCDMRDRDDLTPDMYRHYDKRAKADAEACKKLGLGKEDGVYESVHEDSTQVIEGRIKQHDSVYFDSYTAALAAARAKAEKKGYKIDEEDWASQVTHGYPGRPSVGKTTNKKINLTKNGKPVKPRLIISVYGMKNQFELTSYISESVEVDGDDINESVKPKLITPKEMADYKVKKVLAVGTKPNNESIVATCEWGKKKFVQLEKMGKTGNINQIVQATFFDTEKEAMDEMRDRGFKILKHHGIAIPHLESVDQDEEMVNEYYRRVGSPRWITAIYNGIDSKGKPFKKGEEVLYFPNGKKFYTGAEAERAWQEFLSAKGDEEGRPYAS